MIPKNVRKREPSKEREPSSKTRLFITAPRDDVHFEKLTAMPTEAQVINCVVFDARTLRDLVQTYMRFELVGAHHGGRVLEIDMWNYGSKS